MADQQNSDLNRGGPFGPPPAAPPVRSTAAPYADPFAGMATAPPGMEHKEGREGLWIALAALVGAAVVIAAIAWFTSRGSDEAAAGNAEKAPTAVATTEAPSVDAPTTESPAEGEAPTTTESAVVGAACPDGTREEVCEAAAFIEDFRGKPFKEFPLVEFADEAEFLERYLADFDNEWERDTEIQGDVLGSLGLVPIGTDLVDVTIESFEVGVVGFYDPVGKELVVRGTDLDLYVELVIVHELVHAHDDQWLDLDRPEFTDSNDETFTGFLAVVEGNASRVERAWRAQLPADEQVELSRLELTFYGPDDIAIIQQIPSFVLDLQFFPYRDGPILVEAIAAAAGGGLDGERAVDEAIRNPPGTSEQALHPQQFIDGEAVPIVTAPRAAGEVIDEGVIGEVVFDLWFGDHVGDGWNGDRFVSFESGGQTCTVINVAADSERDLAEIVDAAADWIGQAEPGDSRRSDQDVIDGVDVVVIEGCR